MFGCKSKGNGDVAADVASVGETWVGGSGRGGLVKWLLALLVLAAGAGYAAYRRSADKPDPWATAIPYLPPTSSGDEGGRGASDGDDAAGAAAVQPSSEAALETASEVADPTSAAPDTASETGDEAASEETSDETEADETKA